MNTKTSTSNTKAKILLAICAIFALRPYSLKSAPANPQRAAWIETFTKCCDKNIIRETPADLSEEEENLYCAVDALVSIYIENETSSEITPEKALLERLKKEYCFSQVAFFLGFLGGFECDGCPPKACEDLILVHTQLIEHHAESAVFECIAGIIEGIACRKATKEHQTIIKAPTDEEIRVPATSDSWTARRISLEGDKLSINLAEIKRLQRTLLKQGSEPKALIERRTFFYVAEISAATKSGALAVAARRPRTVSEGSGDYDEGPDLERVKSPETARASSATSLPLLCVQFDAIAQALTASRGVVTETIKSLPGFKDVEKLLPDMADVNAHIQKSITEYYKEERPFCAFTTGFAAGLFAKKVGTLKQAHEILSSLVKDHPEHPLALLADGALHGCLYQCAVDHHGKRLAFAEWSLDVAEVERKYLAGIDAFHNQTKELQEKLKSFFHVVLKYTEPHVYLNAAEIAFMAGINSALYTATFSIPGGNPTATQVLTVEWRLKVAGNNVALSITDLMKGVSVTGGLHRAAGGAGNSLQQANDEQKKANPYAGKTPQQSKLLKKLEEKKSLEERKKLSGITQTSSLNEFLDALNVQLSENRIGIKPQDKLQKSLVSWFLSFRTSSAEHKALTSNRFCSFTRGFLMGLKASEKQATEAYSLVRLLTPDARNHAVTDFMRGFAEAYALRKAGSEHNYEINLSLPIPNIELLEQNHKSGFIQNDPDEIIASACVKALIKKITTLEKGKRAISINPLNAAYLSGRHFLYYSDLKDHTSSWWTFLEACLNLTASIEARTTPSSNQECRADAQTERAYLEKTSPAEEARAASDAAAGGHAFSQEEIKTTRTPATQAERKEDTAAHACSATRLISDIKPTSAPSTETTRTGEPATNAPRIKGSAKAEAQRLKEAERKARKLANRAERAAAAAAALHSTPEGVEIAEIAPCDNKNTPASPVTTAGLSEALLLQSSEKDLETYTAQSPADTMPVEYYELPHHAFIYPGHAMAAAGAPLAPMASHVLHHASEYEWSMPIQPEHILFPQVAPQPDRTAYSLIHKPEQERTEADWSQLKASIDAVPPSERSEDHWNILHACIGYPEGARAYSDPAQREVYCTSIQEAIRSDAQSYERKPFTPPAVRGRMMQNEARLRGFREAQAIAEKKA